MKKYSPLLMAVVIIATPAHCNVHKPLADTITQSTTTLIREYTVPNNAIIHIKGKQDQLTVITSQSPKTHSANPAQPPHRFIKPIITLLSSLFNLFSAPATIILKAEIDLFGSIQEPCSTHLKNNIFTLEITHTKMRHCTIIAPITHALRIETKGALNFYSPYAAFNATAHEIVINSTHPFEYTNDWKDEYKNILGAVNTLPTMPFALPPVILQSTKGEITITELTPDQKNA